MSAADWMPTAGIEALRLRARLYAMVRAFFAERGVLEVETPILSEAGNTEPNIESFTTRFTGHRSAGADVRWLRTSPEYPLKRLLAAGIGDCYELGRVFRNGEAGGRHNPEFSMLEWYRPGFDHHALMDEVAALLVHCGVAQAGARISYREAFGRHAGFDPSSVDVAALRARLRERGVAEPAGLTDDEIADADFWLDLWMSLVIGPQLGVDAPVFIYDFPASQAALAKVRPGNPPVAERFELFWHGIELANGFHELTDAREQRRRFEADQAWRAARGRVVPPFDASLISALDAGMPDCAGVALGLDRLLMLKLGLTRLDRVLAFPADRS